MTPPDNDGAPPFQPLQKYDAPAMPTQEAVTQWLARLYAIFRKDDMPLIAQDQLHKATGHLLDEVVAPPACGPLLQQLDATLEAWIQTPEPPSWLQLIVLPPCDENGVLDAWARERRHAVLAPPARSQLLAREAPEPADLTGSGVLVIARLEAWFLRHHDGLAHVRALLEQLSRCERHCVIGCNTWAWRLLCKAAGADVLLPTPLTFTAFNGERLRHWFTALSRHESTATFAFRLPGSGEDVLATGEDGKPQSDCVARLAARSLGIPWVAWHFWRNSLRSDDKPEAPADEAGAGAMPESAPSFAGDPDEQTLWVAALDQFTLPEVGSQGSLQLLQALLIHGQLSHGELQQVLPMVGETHVLPSLINAGLITRDGEQLRCRPSAYPAIRSGLRSAGFSMPAL